MIDLDKLVYFDIETSGLTLGEHAIIQIAAYCPATGEVFERKLHFCLSKADPRALAVNSYDERLWESEAIHPADAARDFGSYLSRHSFTRKVSSGGGTYDVAQTASYNGAAFDMPWIIRLFKHFKVRMTAEYKTWDAMQLALWLLPDLKSHKLTEVAAHLGVATDGAHDAMADVRMLEHVTRKLMERITV
jgi:DNA polymerase III alpha subunit (gram-positive type)